MKIIDQNNWARREHYNHFKNLEYPYFSLCFTFDISQLRHFCRKNKLSITYSLVYLSSRCANNIPEFRLRIREGEVVEHEIVHPSFTVLREDETFSFCTFDDSEDPVVFFQRAQTEQARVMLQAVMDNESERDDYLFMSPLPWISFTSCTHAQGNGLKDSVPRIAWGKYYEDTAEHIQLPYSIQMHHALADGLHVGKFVEQFQHLLYEPEKLFSTLLN